MDSEMNANIYKKSRNRELVLTVIFLVLSFAAYFFMNYFRGIGQDAGILISSCIFFFCILIFLVMLISFVKHALLVFFHVEPKEQESWTKTYPNKKTERTPKESALSKAKKKYKNKMKFLNEDEPVSRAWVTDLYTKNTKEENADDSTESHQN